MWFKNLRLYRLNSTIEHAGDELEKRLTDRLFQPCGKLDPVKYGWTSPLGRSGKTLTHSALGNTMFCAKREEKVLPSAAVNEALENKVFEIREQEGRPVGRKERMALKEDIVFSLLPQALTKASLDFGYVSPSAKLVVVNASASAKAEAFLNLLRDTTESLKVTPISTHHPIPPMLSAWLKDSRLPQHFEFGENCELRADKDERVVRFRKQDLTATEVKQHLESGMHVKRLTLIWREAIEFTIDDEFALKGLKYSDKLLEQLDDVDTDSAAAAFDSEFTLMTTELNALVAELLSAFGGESEIF
jgi:recombination associated protein RdgC